MKYYIISIGLLLIFLLGVQPDVAAQCAMCKGAAETALKQGGGDPKGLNNGILYMLMMPYMVVGVIGYWWWRNRRKEQEQVVNLTEEDFSQY